MKPPSFWLIPFVLFVLLSSPVCVAGMVSLGEHSGVVIFDRWDGCILYSGIYIMYVSETVKDPLRQYAGKAIQLDVKDIFQPTNPGDGLIQKLEYRGPAPARPSSATQMGVRLRGSVGADSDGKAVATIIIENVGNDPVGLARQEFALTLLMKRTGEMDGLHPSDGPSFALFTRQSFEPSSFAPRSGGKKIIGGVTCTWTIGEEILPNEFTLSAKEKKIIKVKFDLPDGQYDFLSGYGGELFEEECVSSNLTGFNIEKGRVFVLPEQNR